MNPNQTPIQALVNGAVSASISLLDRGLSYGDGVFRTMPVYKGLPASWQLHYQKLSRDCNALKIQCPDEQTLLQDIQALFASADGVAKIIVTRGETARGYSYPADIKPNRVVIKTDLPAYPKSHFEQGVNLHLCATRLSNQPLLAGIKHLNRLENVLGRSEWTDPNIADGVLLDNNDLVIECTMSNVFARYGNQVLTPRLDLCGVSGVTRERLISQLPLFNLMVSEEVLPLSQFMQADEIFICNSLFGVWQVTQFNGKSWAKQTLTDKLNSLLLK